MARQSVLCIAVGAILLPCLGMGWDPAEQRGTFLSEDQVAKRADEFLGTVIVAEESAIKLLSDEKLVAEHPKGAFYAAKCLERIRSIKAIPVLCDRLLYEQNIERYESPVGPKLRNPAFAALVEIGRPAIRPLLMKVATTETTAEYKLVAYELVLDLVGSSRTAADTIMDFRVDEGHRNSGVETKRLWDMIPSDRPRATSRPSGK
ncbi:MAG: hypothetical protein PHU85_08650 [Phycisphaerae bacterium]|nr:hypothetical protein [Phycisphaerae bacterium]